MFEWINESVESFSLARTSREAWLSIKEHATYRLNDGGLGIQQQSLDPNEETIEFTATTSKAFDETVEPNPANKEKIGLSGEVTDTLFPYHIVVDQYFQIVQVGRDLPGLLQSSPEAIVGKNLAEVLLLRRPTGIAWDWGSIPALEGQSFELEPIHRQGLPPLSFKATLTHVGESSPLVMLILTPDAHTFQELHDMNLSIDDLPLHGGYRDAVFLSEHLSSQLNNGVMVEKLTKHLEKEKKLLESLLPSHAAADLRKGKLVKPMVHDNVTFFFSDIVSFTNICDQIHPWQVIEMLNRLYCVMDFLAVKFGLFKVETIGDGK